MSSLISSLPTRSDDMQGTCSSNEITKDFLASDFTDLYPEICTKCGGNNKLRFMFVNEEEAVFKCEGLDCLYPFRDFVFKNFTDNTIYRYKFAQPPDPPDNDSVPLEDLLNFSSSLDSPGESVDFDLDALLDDSSSSSFNDQIDDIKNWLDTGESRNEIKENIERILAEGSDTQRPRKLKKCLAFVKKEFAKQKMKMNENTKVSLKKTMGPLDVMNVIRASRYISPKKSKDLKVEKKSVMPTKPPRKQPTQKNKPTLQKKKVVEPKCFREEKMPKKNIRAVKKNNEQLNIQIDDKKKNVKTVPDTKVKRKPTSIQKDEKSPDPLEGLRRSQRIRTKPYDTIITKAGMKKQYKA